MFKYNISRGLWDVKINMNMFKTLTGGSIKKAIRT
jgi:hypothetical protein